jgi:cytoskeletal protein CcmA (bactofilin family)
MFNFKNSSAMGKNNEINSLSINQIGTGTSINGEIKSNENLRIDGNVTGTVVLKGKLVLGQSGSIEGDIVCQNADISGTIRGNITVSEILTLKASANLKGDISTNKLAIEPGANFSGSCEMGAVVKDIRLDVSEKIEKTA